MYTPKCFIMCVVMMLYGYYLYGYLSHDYVGTSFQFHIHTSCTTHTYSLTYNTHTFSHTHTTHTHSHARTPSRWFSGWTGDHDDIPNRVRQDPAPVGRTLCLSSLQGPHTLCDHHCQRARVLWPVQRTQLSTVWLHTQGQCEVSTL